MGTWRPWPILATVAAAAFAGSVIVFLLSIWLPWLESPARSLVVGSGSMLAALVVMGLNAALQEQVYLHKNDPHPIARMHKLGMRRP